MDVDDLPSGLLLDEAHRLLELRRGRCGEIQDRDIVVFHAPEGRSLRELRRQIQHARTPSRTALRASPSVGQAPIRTPGATVFETAPRRR